MEMFTNKKTGEKKLFLKVDGKWIPYEEAEAKATSPGRASLIAAGKKTRDLVEGIDQIAGLNLYNDPGTKSFAALEREHPFAVGAGKMGSELAQIALPAGAIGKATKLKPWLTDLAAAVPLAASRLPEEGGTRGEAAGSEALWSLLGSAGTRLASGLFKPNAVAREALDRGEYLTPAYATDSNFLNAIESAAEVTPGTASAVKRLRGEAQRDWRNNVFNTVANKLGINVTGDTGTAAFRQIDDAVSQGYKSALAKITSIPDDAFDVMFKSSGKRSANLNPNDQTALKVTLKRLRTLRKQIARGRKGQNPNEVADSIDALLRDKAAGAEGPLREQYVNMRKQFHSQLEPNIAAELKKLDEVFPDMLVLNDAVSTASKEMMEGGFSPKQLMQGSASKGSGRTFARGESPLYDIALAGGKTVGKREGGAPLEWFRRLAGGVPSPPGMRSMGNAIIGETVGQKAVKDLPEYLLRNVAPSRIAPAAADESDDENLWKEIKDILGL